MRLQAAWNNRLTGWFRAALALASKTWEKQLTPTIQTSFRELNTAFAGDALGKLPDGTVALHTMVDDPRLPTMLTMPRSLLLSLVGVMLGTADASVEDRELTMVEENLADYFLTQFWLPSFRDTWPGKNLVAWHLGDRDPQPQCSRFYPASEILVVLEFTVRGPWGENNAAWLFPQKALQELLGNDSGVSEDVSEKVLAARREALVQSLPMTVQITLGSAELKLSDLSALRVGDVVLLDQRTTEDVAAKSGERTLFKGTAGRVGSWRAVQVVRTRDK